MIAEKELRIGATYEFIDGYLFQGEIRSLDDADFWKAQEYNEDICDNIEPILLTEEWLKRLGFYGSASLERYIGPSIGTLGWDDKGVYLIADNSGPYLPHIQYVHQLQNLYFALTGDELPIQEYV
jgi:hypothetical protein